MGVLRGRPGLRTLPRLGDASLGACQCLCNHAIVDPVPRQRLDLAGELSKLPAASEKSGIFLQFGRDSLSRDRAENELIGHDVLYGISVRF